MAERGVCYVPTVSVGGRNKQQVLKYAVDAGVTICNGADSGPVAHGDNARGVEGLVTNGLTPLQALRAATVNDAKMLGMGDRLGAVKTGYLADLIAVRRRSDEGHFGDPTGAVGHEGRDGLQTAVADPLFRPFRSGKCWRPQVRVTKGIELVMSRRSLRKRALRPL